RTACRGSRDFPSSLDSCLCQTARPTFLSYWTKVQYTAFSLYARNSEGRVRWEELLRTLYSILFPRHSFACPRLCRKRDGSNKRTRNFRVIDDCFLARTAIESGRGVTTTQHAASQRRRTGETDRESIPTPGDLQCGKTGVLLGLAVAFSGAVAVSEVSSDKCRGSSWGGK